MPWLDNYIFRFGADGLIHTTRQQNGKSNGRKEVINEITYNDAHVCLTCPYEECSGERECFLKRKKELEEKK